MYPHGGSSLWLKICVYVTYGEVNILVENVGCQYRFVGFFGNLRNEAAQGRRAPYELAPRGKQRHVEIFIVLVFQYGCGLY